ncbi:hypothetical protein Pelo_12630 [Pelomyxa schiedti]|nr:hypothetical protein Pelo_12630 [Pelomyxa schiedti]
MAQSTTFRCGLVLIVSTVLQFVLCRDSTPISGLVAAPEATVAFGSPVTFIAWVSTGDNVVYQWFFPEDNVTAYGDRVVHSFIDEGPYGNYTAVVVATNEVSTAQATTTAAFATVCSNVKVLPTGSLYQGQCPGSDNNVRILNSAVDSLNIKSGDTLVSPDCGGLIMLLTGDSFANSGYWKYLFEFGGIEDVFSDSHFSIPVDLSTANNSTEPVPGADFSLVIHWEPDDPYVLYNNSLSSVTVLPSFDFTPMLSLQVITANHSLIHLSYSIAGKLAVSLETVAYVGAKLSTSGSEPIISWPFKSVVFFVLGIPFVASPALTLYTGFSLSIGDVAEVKSVLVTSSSVKVEMSWDVNDGFGAESESTFYFNEETPELSFGCSATISVWLQPALVITIDKVFPLSLSISGSEEVGFSVPPPWEQSTCPCKDSNGNYKGLLSTSSSIRSSISLGLPKNLGSFTIPLWDESFPGNSTCINNPPTCPGVTCTKCPEHCGSDSCDSQGICSYCDLGWWGPYCDQPCCSSEYCRHCGTTSHACDQYSGECSYCDLGYWGDNCDLQCYPPRHCGTTAHACDMGTGVCSYCDLGWWGTNCDMSCAPRHCGASANACDMYDGHCGWCEACWSGTDCLEYVC